MENVRTVSVYVNTVDTITVQVAAGMRAAVYGKATLALPSGKTGKCRAKQPGAYNQVLVWFQLCKVKAL